MAGRPIIVLSPGRSGSSLVAGIFAAHGVWTGDTMPGNEHNPHGYFENREMRRYMLYVHGRGWLGEPPEAAETWPNVVRGTLNNQGYKEGPWLFKCGAFYWKVWQPFAPLYVKVWRPIEAILASFERCGFLKGRYTDTQICDIVTRQHGLMKHIHGPDIDAGRLVAGERDEIRPAMECAGLSYDEGATDAFIDPKAWHETG